MNRFTVFTPTYNRINTLERVYESLKKQSFKDFIWLIVDDGSSDYTKEIVNNWIKEDIIKIKYLYKNNGGKHTAWRTAMNYVDSKYMVGIDSDDTLTEDALMIFNMHWENLEKSHDYDFFWEVKGRCKNEKGDLIGKVFPQNIIDCYYTDMTYKLKYKNEMHGCRKVTVLQNEAKVPDNFFMENHCNNFPEGVRWARAGKKYKTRYINEIVRTYYFDQSDQLMKDRGKYFLYNTLVGTKYILEEIGYEIKKNDLFVYYKNFMVLQYVSYKLKINPLKIISFSKMSDKFIFYLLLPITFFISIVK